jgi:DNA-binding FadR family transcriptional regulator
LDKFLKTTITGQKLSHNVAHQLGLAIVAGTYTTKKPIPTEGDLRSQFNVSRGVIREALSILSGKGLVDTRSSGGRGIRPQPMWRMLDPDVLGWLLARKCSPQLLLQFTEFRLAIEPGAASLAAQMAGDSDRVAIHIALARMRAAHFGDDDPLESEIAFHDALLRASDNSFYVQLRPFIATALRFHDRIANRYKSATLTSIEDHAKIAEAVMKRNPVAAAAAIRVPIQEVLNRIANRDRDHLRRRT